MPQGPSKLHDKWGGDAAALDHLAGRGLRPNRGGVFVIPRDFALTIEDHSALDYLCLEWDYSSEREK